MKSDSSGALSSLKEEVEVLRAADERQKRIIERLEEHVTRLTSGKRVPNEDEELSASDLLAESLGVDKDTSRLLSQPSASSSTGGSSGQQSMIDIVTAQRDRLKQRLVEVEQSVVEEKSTAARLQSEMDKLREDNTKLYGKIQFLQSHRSGTAKVTIEDDGTYKQEWEQKLSPFDRFTSMESLRHQQKLPIHDKATLSIARAVVSNASARFAFFCYLLALHLLIFIVLYYTAWTSASDRDSDRECNERFAQHMKEHHH